MWLVCHFVEKIVQKETGYKLDSNFGDVVKYSLQMMQRHFWRNLYFQTWHL